MMMFLLQDEEEYSEEQEESKRIHQFLSARMQSLGLLGLHSANGEPASLATLVDLISGVGQ